MPGSLDSSGSQDQEPSQLEELADFMEQVWAFSPLRFSLIFSLQVIVLKMCSLHKIFSVHIVKNNHFFDSSVGGVCKELNLV